MDKKDLVERIKEAVEALPAESSDQLEFEAAMFITRLQMLDSDDRVPSGEEIKAELYELLFDDFIYFLRKVQTGSLIWKELSPRFQRYKKKFLSVLKQLGIQTAPRERPYLRITLLENWFDRLFKTGLLNERNLFHFVTIFQNRLFSLTDRPPYGFTGESGFTQLLMGDKNALSFEELYQAEIYLRREIIQHLVRNVSRTGSPHYLVQKEIITALSDNFIKELHASISGRLETILQRQRDFNQRILEQNRHYRNEFHTAGLMHDKIIQRELPDGGDLIDFELWYAPLMTIGGDYYRVLKESKDRFFIFLGDITGHGLSAAIYYNTLHLAFEKHMDSLNKPARFMKHLNTELYGKLSGNFITAIALYIDLGKRRIRYCNAAHPKAFLYNFRQGPEATARFLRPTGKVVGAFKNVSFREGEISLEEDVRLAVYTDGLTETFNEKGRMFGERRLLGALENTHTENLKMAVQSVLTGLAVFQGATRTEDDRTLLLCQINL